MIKSNAFLFAAIWSWPGLKLICKRKHKTLEKYIIITLLLQRHLELLKDLFFVFVFLLCCYMHLSKFTWKQVNMSQLAYNQLSISSFSIKLIFHVCFIYFDCDYISGSLKNYCHKYKLQCRFSRGRLMNIIYR